MTTDEILTAALREIGVLNAVDPAGGEDATLALQKLNAILDEWNADARAVYADTIETYTLTPALNPHTIGPGGTFVTTQRPQRIVAASVLQNGVRSPVRIREADWWMSLGIQTTSADRPSDLYYEPAWPLGRIWFAGVPSAANTIEIQSRVVLAQLAASTTFTLPPGYQKALTLTLAEELTTPFRVALLPQLAQKAQLARAKAFAANGTVVRLLTRVAGMPGGSRWGGYDWRTGKVG